jgi:hypothetical protein
VAEPILRFKGYLLLRVQTYHAAAWSQWRLKVERTRYEAELAERAIERWNRRTGSSLALGGAMGNRLRDLAPDEAKLHASKRTYLEAASPGK